MIGPERLRELEPDSSGIKAIHVPGTCITDYAAVAKKFAEIVAKQGGWVRTRARVTGITARLDETVGQSTQEEFAGKYFVNCTGLHNERVSKFAGGNTEFIIAPFRGAYYDRVPG